jgi:hypothetical protein
MINRLPCPITGSPYSHSGSGRRFSSKSTLLRHLCHTDHQPTFHLADHSLCSTVGIYTCCHTSCPTAPTQFFRSLKDLLQHTTLHHPPPPNLTTTATTTPLHHPHTPTQQFHPPTPTRQFSRVQIPPTPPSPPPPPDYESTMTSDDESSTNSPRPHDLPTYDPTHTPTTPLLLSTSFLYPEANSGTHNLWHHGLHFISSKYDHHPPDFQSNWDHHLKRDNKIKLP